MASQTTTDRDDIGSLRRHGWLGLVATIGLFGGLLAWAMATEISGALISSGTLMVQSNAKLVQHPEGGLVSKLLVSNEDFVEAGQLLIVLDQTALSATVAVSESQLRQSLMQEARLLAEIEGRSKLEMSGVALDLFDVKLLEPLRSLEQQILDARLATKTGRIAQLREQIVQLDRQREGLSLQKSALESQIEILEKEHLDFDTLFANQLVAVSRGTALDKEAASATGQLGQVVAAIAESRATASERALQIAQIEDEFLTNALADLAETRRSINEVSQRRLADLDRFARTEIRAPQSGIVHETILHTIGGVVPAGETLMTIVPTNEPLLVNARIQTVDIDRVHVGQNVVLRFPGLNPRTTPELMGHVDRIAPDTTQDASTGLSFYSMRVSIAEEQLLRLPKDTALLPGMPVEAYVQLADRTVMAYLIQPFVDHLRIAMREE